jgi:transcriptional regulator EpsA
MTSTTLTPPDPGAGLAPAQAEALIRLIEAAPSVRRRYQFFVWMQNHLRALLPHQVAICGAWQRQHRSLVLEAFHAVPLPDGVLLQLTSSEGPLVQAMVRAWLANRCRPLALSVSALEGLVRHDGTGAVLEAGLDQWLVHAVSRPSRPHELESMFLFCTPGQPVPEPQAQHAELLMPHLHSTYLRMQAFERDLGLGAPPQPVRELGPAMQITPRERQILSWVREGMSNQQIGEVLGISALTVKNHVQKILRKLGAANRAQAVAKAMAMNLLAGSAEDLAH